MIVFPDFRREEAREAYRQALELATNRVEQDYLRRRLSVLEGVQV